MKLFVDLHIHSCLSPCGDELMTPGNIAGMAFLKGLDAIAVCDHNTAGNLPAIKAAAEMMGVVLLPGIELTTREEVHLLCYFKEIDAAMAFSREIYAHLPDIPNNPGFFGGQIYMDDQDEITGEEPKLLINALDLSFEECAALCLGYGGACVPAHIGKQASGVLGVLGFLPELPCGEDYDALEVSGGAFQDSEAFSNYMKLKSSDAHQLEDIFEKVFWIDAEEKSAEALFSAIKRRSGAADSVLFKNG